ncbi:MAG: 2-C-methyl-D-erythritol 2,4-cyclodiphosphate synthase [Treponemataceae bacterium]|nr:2-C-methyl-D-erythritol 2,4-cyclodiphosphate synthase [Treponemataceae bacterium]
MRVGLGTDLHRLVPGRKLIIGGVEFDFELGEDGHSDGDVLLHAITDSLLGAAGISDIGELFPPSDDKWKGADSAELLKEAYKLVKEAGWKIENIDCVVQLEKPKFLPHRKEVCKNIAAILQIEENQVFVKAKTGEKLAPIGTSEAISAQVVCLLSK